MELNDYWERMKEVFVSGKHKILARDLKALISKALISVEQGGEMIVTLLGEDPEWMLEKVYPLLRVKPQFKIELLDEYIIKKYCLAPEEEILDMFYATIFEGKATTTGDVYLTNVRMIVSGRQSVKSAQRTNYAGTSPLGVLAGSIVRGKITQKRRNLRAEISKALK